MRRPLAHLRRSWDGFTVGHPDEAGVAWFLVLVLVLGLGLGGAWRAFTWAAGF